MSAQFRHKDGLQIAKASAAFLVGLVTAHAGAQPSDAPGQSAEAPYYQDPSAPSAPPADLAPVQPDAWFEGREPPKAVRRAGVFLDLRLGALLPVAFGPGLDKTTAGWDVGLGVGLDRLPLTLGFDFANSYGWPSYNDRVVDVNGQATSVHQRRQDHVVFFSTLLRVQPQFSFLRPYAEGIVGGQWYKTDYRLSFPSSKSSSESSSNHSHTRALGFGAGFDFLFGEPPGTWTLTLGIRRIYGGPASITQTVINSQQDQRSVHERLATDWMVYTAAIGGRVEL